MDELTTKPGIWRCSICTYENDEISSSCDICGVVRDLNGIIGNDSERDVHGKQKGSGVSIMARSLFTPSPSRMPKAALITDGLQATRSEKGYMHTSFNDLQRTFMPPIYNPSVNITPFKFDTPSPDDIVSAGKKPSGTFLKVDTAPSTSAKASSGIKGKKAIVNVLPDNRIAASSSASLVTAGQLDEDESNNNTKEDAAQTLEENLTGLKLDKNSRHNKSNKAMLQYQPEKWMLSDEEQLPSQLNLAIGKGSFAYAWAMDESTYERERGITMTVAVAYFESKNYRVVLLDSPGHKDFVPNMISGATQADAAVLVVDASIGSFEAGMSGNGVGQTKEHAQLTRSFGVEHIIIAVNKMDVVDFSKERFELIKSQLGLFLCSCGFKELSMTWVPLSAMENQNLVATASDTRLTSWYTGYCLLDAIDSLQPPHRDVSKPLLLPICDVITSHTLGQVAACGKLETGAIRVGSKVLLMPSGDLATVRTIERDSTSCSMARAGDNIAVSLPGVDASHVIQGGVLCQPNFPVKVATSLELKVLVLDITIPILVGVQVKLDGAVCVEEFSNCRALGRVFLRASGSTIAVGIVVRVLEH
ncbi:HBS1-like protein [Ananas comosus]|uniref:HBS1-like protein n=1 Tax=Ananas comosus TaxID=4615 RepID=A0A199UVC1_ANACO|nr:HBS1-like protein [Ananas comosus]